MPTPRKLSPAETNRPQAHQDRSQRTEARLLAAAARLLTREGLEAATAPRIAAEARLSPGSIYRRFTNKDDLLQSALLLALTSPASKKEAPAPAPRSHASLQAAAEHVVHTLVRQSRQQAPLVAALHRFLEQRPHPQLAKQVQQRRLATLEPAMEALLHHRSEIRHPDPPSAAHFAVLSAASLAEAALGRSGSPWGAALALPEKALAAELTRQMVAYLRRKP